MARILITGFEPFDNFKKNISQEIVQEFPSSLTLRDPWSKLRQQPMESIDLDVEKMVLTVDEQGSSTVSDLLAEGLQWDAIIHLGLCSSCDLPRIETLAQNRIEMRIPDNSGRQILSSTISDSGDLSVILPVNSWTNLPWSVDCEVSKDAGTFVCNETLYRSLKSLQDQENLHIPCLFVHLPVEQKCSVEKASEFLHEIMQRMFFRPVLSVVGGLFWRDGNYMIARRKIGELHAGKWEFPGGKVEQNESKITAIKREMMEEFGWKVSASPSIGTWYHSLPDFEIALHIMPLQIELADLNDQTLWTSHDAILWRKLDDDSPLEWLGNDRMVVEWMRENKYNG